MCFCTKICEIKAIFCKVSWIFKYLTCMEQTKYLAIFTGKHLCWSLLNKATGLKLEHRCFQRFLRTPFFTELLRWLLLQQLNWRTNLIITFLTLHLVLFRKSRTVSEIHFHHLFMVKMFSPFNNYMMASPTSV